MNQNIFVSVTSLDKICRVCLKESEEMQSIFNQHRNESYEHENKYIYEILMSITMKKINSEDRLPNLICSNCLNLANTSYSFQQQYQRSQIILEKYLDAQSERNNFQKKEEIEVPNEQLDDKFPNQEKCILLKSSNETQTDEQNKISCSSRKHRAILSNLNDSKEVNNNENDENKRVENFYIADKVNTDTEKDKINSNSLVKKNFKQKGKKNGLLTKTSVKFSYYFKSDENLYECNLCGEKFKDHVNLKLHIRERKQDKPFVCNLCGKGFTKYDLLLVHSKQEKMPKKQNKFTYYLKINESGEHVYECNLCDETFKFYKNFQAHIRDHNRENPFICNLCGKNFPKYTLLAAHVRTHTEERPHVCKICGKKYKQTGGLTQHMRVHTGQRPFLCSVCGKGFRQSPDLRYHMRTHTKERPYMCNVCGKLMTMQSHLVQHMRIHTGEKPHKCLECNKAFPSLTSLRKHTIIHTDLKPFSCEVCNKSFNRRSTLKVHAKIHTDERPHACPICEKRFLQKHVLRSHILTHSSKSCNVDS